MSYIRAKKVDVEEGAISRDGRIPALELPDHVNAGGGEALDLDANLDDEIIPFVRDLLGKIEDLGEGEALVVWKVVF